MPKAFLPTNGDEPFESAPFRLAWNPQSVSLFLLLYRRFAMRLALIPTIFAVAACAPSGVQTAKTVAVSEVASARLIRGDGSEAGVATLSRRDDGIWLEVASASPGEGRFGMHIHTVGKCEGPDFTTAGAHWNPASRQHGRDNPAGAHAGDLPNVAADASGRISAMTQLVDAIWSGEGGIFDADGASIIIHEKADDYKTDPTGNSGKRVICGVFSKK
jgi:superoxide dismutase, Cu-Zn family